MSKKKNKKHAGNQDDSDGGKNESKKESKIRRMREAIRANLNVVMKYFSLMTFVGISALLLFNEQTRMPFDQASRDVHGKELWKLHQAVLAHSKTEFPYMAINPLPAPIFWLRSKLSGKCFGPKGYAKCGLRNIWTYEKFNQTISIFPHLSPAPQEQLCLSQSCHNCANPQVVVGDCRNPTAKDWKLKPKDFQVQKKLISYYDGYDAEDLGMFCMSSGSRPRISDCEAAGEIETFFISIDALLCEINPDEKERVLKCNEGPFWPEEPYFKGKRSISLAWAEDKFSKDGGFVKDIFNEDESDSESSDDENTTVTEEHSHSTAPEIMSGHYEIKINVIEVHDLKCENVGKLSDPYVEAEVFGEKKHTSYKKKTSTAVFDQWLYFSKELQAEDIRNGEIVIRVMHHNLINSYCLLGLIVVRTEDVYRQKNHMLWKHEFCLLNELLTEVQGYITCTIAILGPEDDFKTYSKGDKVPEIIRSPESSFSFMPTSLKRERYWLTLSVFRVEDVPIKKGKSDTDTFIRIDFGESSCTVLQGRRVHGNPWVLQRQIHLPVVKPTPRKHLFFSVWDKADILGSDILRGFFMLKLKDIKKRKRSDIGKPRWFNLYHNSSQEVYGKSFSPFQFNCLDDIATEYNGRVLLSAQFEEQTAEEIESIREPSVIVEDEKTLKKAIDKHLKDPENTVQEPRSETYVFGCHVTYGYELPVMPGYVYRLRIAIGRIYERSTKAMKSGEMIMWDQDLRIENIEVPERLTSVPDAFIYLEKGKGSRFEIVSFKRFTAVELVDTDDSTIGFELMHLQWASQKVKPPKPPKAPGSIMMQLYLKPIRAAKLVKILSATKIQALWRAKRVRTVYRFTRKHPLRGQMQEHQSAEQIPKLTVPHEKSSWDMFTDFIEYELRVHCYQARDLPITDSSGASDPFVEVHYLLLGKDPVRTKTHTETRDPQFFETLKMDVSLPPDLLTKSPEEVDTAVPPVSILVWDQDKIGKEFTGKCLVKMSKASNFSKVTDINNVESYPDPEWYTLYVGEKESGKIMVSLQLIEKSKIPERVVDGPNIKPEMIKTHIEVTVLGLRSLSPKGAEKIENPYIKFHLDGKCRKKNVLFKSKKSRCPYPENPNFCQVLSTEENGPIDMPKNPLFAPTLHLRVKDSHIGRPNTRLGMTRIHLDNKYSWASADKKTAERGSTPLARQSTVKEVEVNNFAVPKLKNLPDLKSRSEKRLQGLEDDGNEEGEKSDFSQPSQQNQANQEAKEDKGELQGVKEQPTGQDIRGAEETTRDLQKLQNESAKKIQAQVRGQQTRRKMRIWNVSFMVRKLGGKKKGNLSNVEEGQDLIAKEEKKLIQDEEQIEKGPYSHIKDDMKDRAILKGSLQSLLKTVPFDDIVIHRRNHKTKEREDVGLFKGFIRIYADKTEKDCAETMKSYVKELKPGSVFEVRVYILRATHLRPVDEGLFTETFVDPYIKIQLGSINQQTTIDRDNALDNTNDPDFFKMYDLKDVYLPGPSQLTISVFDKNQFFQDTLIGETTVDLEDRWFDRRWQNLGVNAENNNSELCSEKDCNNLAIYAQPDPNAKVEKKCARHRKADMVRRLRPKPVEKHKLRVPHKKTNQGFLFFWIDILPLADTHIYKPVNIELPEVCKIQIRVIIWATKTLKGKDVSLDPGTKGLNDLYVKAWVQGQENNKQSTDTHWRAHQMNGSFNWRMKFDVEIGPAPARDAELLKFPNLYYQVWDHDVFTRDDYIGQGDIKMTNLLKCYRERTPQQLYDDHKKTKDQAGKDEEERKKRVQDIVLEKRFYNCMIGLISIIVILIVGYLFLDTYRVIEVQSSMKWTKDMYFKMIQRIDETDQIYSKIFYIRDPEDGKCIGRKGFKSCAFDTVWGVTNQSHVAFLKPALTFTIVGYPPNGPADKKPNGMECLAPSHCQKMPALIKAGNCDKCGADTWNFDKQKVIVNEMCIKRLQGSPFPTTVNCTRTINGKPAYTELMIIETSANALKAVAGMRLDILHSMQSLPRTIWRMLVRQKALILYITLSVSLLVVVYIQLSIYQEAKLAEKETDVSKLSSSRANARELARTVKSFFGKLDEKHLKAIWVDVKLTKRGSDPEKIGEMLITCEAVPKREGDSLQVGSGRDPPNQDPYLPPPSGRLRFTLNPFHLLAELVGAEMMFRIVAILFFVVVIPLSYAVYLYLTPYITLVELLSELIFYLF